MTLPPYHENPLEYYEALRQIPPDELPHEWQEISLDGYYRPAYLQTFNPETFTGEIRETFNL